MQKILKNSYDDIRTMEAMLKNSNVDFTIVRPPRLTDQKATGNYRFAINDYLQKSFSITRHDLAKFIIDNLENVALNRAIVEVAN